MNHHAYLYHFHKYLILTTQEAAVSLPVRGDSRRVRKGMWSKGALRVDPVRVEHVVPKPCAQTWANGAGELEGFTAARDAYLRAVAGWTQANPGGVCPLVLCPADRPAETVLWVSPFGRVCGLPRTEPVDRCRAPLAERRNLKYGRRPERPRVCLRWKPCPRHP